MKILGIIPARYESSRLPGKALALIGEKPMLQHVYERASESELLTDIIVATDDLRIKTSMDQSGIPVIMTSSDHRSGTERSNEALAITGDDYDYVINIQGDEPFIDPRQIDTLAKLCNGKAEIATLISPLKDESELTNPNVVKVVCAADQRALYFSRSPIPYFRDGKDRKWTEHHSYWKHIGMYAYRSDILPRLSTLRPGILEEIESLEQLRWLEHGFSIITGESNLPSLGVDTREDLEKARLLWKSKQI
ncbi:MAG: 3-deoxy-manno-octulosonate cytidylyltransferase [Cyclobacteriaceae bacterium]